MSAADTAPERSVTTKSIFCDHCIAETSDKTPGNISTVNGIGRVFYGGAAPCPECGSVIRTLWWCFSHVPIIPLGSYRYRTTTQTFLASRSEFWTRKLPRRYWRQIWSTWALGFLGVIAVVAGIMIYSHWRQQH